MIRKLVGRALLCFTRPARPDLPVGSFLSREECRALETALPVDASPTTFPTPSLTAMIDAYAAPTPASDKRGEYLAARRLVAIARLRAELDRYEQVLRVAAQGTPDSQASRLVGLP